MRPRPRRRRAVAFLNPSKKRENSKETRMRPTCYRAVAVFATVASAFALAWSPPASARVTKLTINVHESPTYGGQSFGTVGQFEKLIGTAAGELDPNDRRNAIIQDIQL